MTNKTLQKSYNTFAVKRNKKRQWNEQIHRQYAQRPAKIYVGRALICVVSFLAISVILLSLPFLVLPSIQKLIRKVTCCFPFSLLSSIYPMSLKLSRPSFLIWPRNFNYLNIIYNCPFFFCFIGGPVVFFLYLPSTHSHLHILQC